MKARSFSLLEGRVFRARLELLVSRSVTPVAAGVGYAALLCFFLRNLFSHDLLFVWFGLKVFAASVRLIAAFLYLRTPTRRILPDRSWAVLFFGLIAFDGLTWSLTGILFGPADRPDLIAAMMASLAGVSAVGTMALSVYLPAHLVFCVSIIGPAATYQIVTGLGTFGFYAGTSTLMFLILMTIAAIRTSRSTVDLIRLRYQMTELAKERAGALREARRNAAAKGQFIATMSHELRTPLHGILGLVRQLIESSRDDTGKKPLELIEQSGSHLLTIINDVLDFSRVDSGRIEINDRPYDLVELIRQVIALSAPSAQAKSLALWFESDLDQPTWVLGDAERVRQILLNLLGNAIKFTRKGSVTASLSSVADRARICVVDSGPGIPEDQLSRIFDPFHQAEQATNRRFEGTGLGLAIARELARAMGGEIKAANNPTVGATFTIDLPLRLCNPPADSRPGGGRSLLRGRVLVVEDNEVSSLLVQTMLRSMGVETVLAENGEVGFKQYTLTRPEAILMDCHMPGMDGFDTTLAIRREEKEHGYDRVPIIALTADVLPESRERCFAVGMDDYMSKPFRKEALWELLARYLPAQ